MMMLIGANSRDVVHARQEARRRDPAASCRRASIIEPIYDRADFVGPHAHDGHQEPHRGRARRHASCSRSSSARIRGALVVVLGIPASMAIALFGMHLFGVTGDLMSLGAIDFGFLVDGPIVILEAVIAALGRARRSSRRARDGAYAEVAAAVARPVAFAVAIIMLVYLPLLTLEGIEGKMFRPMAITMACALFGALVYSVVFFPALLVAFVPPAKGHGPALDRRARACVRAGAAVGDRA